MHIDHLLCRVPFHLGVTEAGTKISRYYKKRNGTWGVTSDGRNWRYYARINHWRARRRNKVASYLAR